MTRNPRSPKVTKRARLLDELRGAGKLANGHGLVDKQPTLVLEGMVEKLRTDQRARESGAPDCPEHTGQVQGACPICRGIWKRPEEPEYDGPA